jgi:hypothetical protein
MGKSITPPNDDDNVADRLYRHLGPVTWKTETTLACELGMSRRQIRKAKEKLEEQRKIVITWHWNGKRSNPRHEIVKRTGRGKRSLSNSLRVDPVCVSAWSELSRMDLIELYLKSNWQIIPLRERSKQPVMSQRLWRQVSDSRDAVIDYFYHEPNKNIGLLVQGMTVIDLDTKAIPDNFCCAEFDKTLTSETGKGFQFFFKADPVVQTSVKVLGEAIDTRCNSSFVTLPPSVHETGFTYRWVTCGGLADLPIRIRRTWQKNFFERGYQSQGIRLPAVIAEGSRNDTLFRYGRSLRKQGKSVDELKSEMTKANAFHCKPSLGSTELRRLIRNVWYLRDRA